MAQPPLGWRSHLSRDGGGSSGAGQCGDQRTSRRAHRKLINKDQSPAGPESLVLHRGCASTARAGAVSRRSAGYEVMEFPVTAIMISLPGVWAPALIPTQDSFPPFLPRNKSHRLDVDSLLMLTIADWEFAFTSPASARPGYPSAIIPLGACRPRLPRLHPRLRSGMTRE